MVGKLSKDFCKTKNRWWVVLVRLWLIANIQDKKLSKKMSLPIFLFSTYSLPIFGLNLLLF
jgi:hypothetical protein